MKFDEITDKWVLEEVQKLKYTYNLNKVIRYNLERKEELETQSVAEHVYNMLVLAHYFHEHEDSEHKLDFAKVVRMILMHDMGEIETGDIQMHNKNLSHTEEETKALEKVVASTPEFIQKEIKELCDEYNNYKTPESKFVKAIDKIEQQFWHSVFCEPKMVCTTCTLEQRIENEVKRRSVYKKCGFKIIEKFGRVIHEDMCKRNPDYCDLEIFF